MIHRMDLNADLGEGFGVYTRGDEAALMAQVTSANIACGFHAGDPSTMARTVALAVKHGVALGAHPGLPDLVGFGRRALAVTPSEVWDLVAYQIGALAAFARRHRQELGRVKPHGALYALAEQDMGIAEAIAQAVSDAGEWLVLVGQSGGWLTQAGEAAGLRVAHEVFADRAYLPNGALLPRDQPGAVLTDPEVVTARVVQLVRDGTLTAIDGSVLNLRADTLCVHGDTPGAAALAAAVRATLEAEGVAVRSFDAL